MVKSLLRRLKVLARLLVLGLALIMAALISNLTKVITNKRQIVKRKTRWHNQPAKRDRRVISRRPTHTNTRRPFAAIGKRLESVNSMKSAALRTENMNFQIKTKIRESNRELHLHHYLISLKVLFLKAQRSHPAAEKYQKT